MNTKFTLALLTTAVMGRTREEIRESMKHHRHHSVGVNDGTAEFHDFIGRFGKSYTSMEQMSDRL